MSSTASGRRVSRLLIVSSGAGNVTDEVRDRLLAAFSDHTMVEFDPRHDFRTRLTPRARVIVAGGDGTVGFVARALAGSRQTLGVLPTGTYNNFARGLGMPEDLDAAIAVIRRGNTGAATLGRANDVYFLEAAAIGLFGKAIAMGDNAKEHQFGDFATQLRAVAGARAFEFALGGDIDGSGKALSLVFANNPSIGVQMPISDNTPRDPFLELSVRAGATRTDIVGRVLASAILDRHADTGGMVLRFRALRIATKPRVDVYADNIRVGRTPLTISAEPGALRVFVP